MSNTYLTRVLTVPKAPGNWKYFNLYFEISLETSGIMACLMKVS